jgi:hypothetical protein
MKRFTVKTLDGMEWTARDLLGIKKMVGDRVFVPVNADLDKFDFNAYYRNVVLANKNKPKVKLNEVLKRV